MCPLDGMLTRVQAPRRVAQQQLVLGSSFCGSGSSNHEPSDHAAALHCIVAAILIGGWQMRALWKTHDPSHRFAWSAADRAANNACKMAALTGAIESASRFDGDGES